jgi:hypothetical protein
MKTKMCRFYANGLCRFEEGCPFAHSPDDLTTPPDLRKTMLCEDWKRGACKRSSESCPFAHGEEELCITPAFSENPLSKRMRALAESQGLAFSSDSDQDADQACLEEVETVQPPPLPAQKGERQPRAVEEGRLTSRAGRRQQQRKRNGGGTERAPVIRCSMAAMATGANAQEPAWDSDGSNPTTACSTPTYAAEAAMRAPWIQASPFLLVQPIFDNTSPERVAEILRMAMPDHYED